MKSSMCSTDGKGRWWRRTWEEQCSGEVFMYGRCQGVKGHKSVHWCYSPCGSFCYSDNDDDPTENGCAGTIPPDHKTYRHPKDMQKLYYMEFSSDEEITDPDEIARLERGEMRDNESINRPVTDPEILKMLRQRGENKPGERP